LIKRRLREERAGPSDDKNQDENQKHKVLLPAEKVAGA
jgi:hypothetical protein